VSRLTALCVCLAAVAVSTAGWQLAAHGLETPSALVAMGAVVVACSVIGLLARAGWLGRTLTAGPVLRRGVALRRKSWGAAFQRQLDPDAAGRARPRAPSTAPAAA